MATGILARVAGDRPWLQELKNVNKASMAVGVPLAGVTVLGSAMGQAGGQLAEDDPMSAAASGTGAVIGGALGTGLGALGYAIPSVGWLAGPALMAAGGHLGAKAGGMVGTIASEGVQGLTGQNDPYLRELKRSEAAGTLMSQLQADHATRMTPIEERRLQYLADLQDQDNYQRALLGSIVDQYGVAARNHGGIMNNAMSQMGSLAQAVAS